MNGIESQQIQRIINSNMANKLILVNRVLIQALEALQRGDKHAARRWAQIAVSMAPEKEYPWLILAAVAKPRASLAYLERALEINPGSERARKGLEWAQERVATEQAQPAARKIQTAFAHSETPAELKPVAQKGKSSFHIPSRAASPIRVSFPILFLLLVLCLMVAWIVRPGANSSLLTAIHSSPNTTRDNNSLHVFTLQLIDHITGNHVG